jgi:NADPH:quinone reductase-like Zn-dependent oxidoreductase
VLVNGAAGGVGSFAVQITKAFGAHVTGVCSTSKIDLVRSIGADEGIDYTLEDIAQGARRYDVIFDTAGNREVSDLRRILVPKGTLVLAGGEGGGWWLGMGRVMSRHEDEGHLALRRAEDEELPRANHGRRPPRVEGAHRDRQGNAGDRRETSAQRCAGRDPCAGAGHGRGKVVITV